MSFFVFEKELLKKEQTNKNQRTSFKKRTRRFATRVVGVDPDLGKHVLQRHYQQTSKLRVHAPRHRFETGFAREPVQCALCEVQMTFFFCVIKIIFFELKWKKDLKFVLVQLITNVCLSGTTLPILRACHSGISNDVHDVRQTFLFRILPKQLPTLSLKERRM